MQNKWKFRFGVISCLLGVIILVTSLLTRRFIPGGFALLVIGFILISNSRKK